MNARISRDHDAACSREVLETIEELVGLKLRCKFMCGRHIRMLLERVEPPTSEFSPSWTSR